MNMVDYYRNKLEQYKTMYDVCIKLLSFKHDSNHKKEKLKEFKNEVIESGNTNRIKAAKRIANQAEYKDMDILKLNNELAKILGISIIDTKINEYDEYIKELELSNPKDYLVKCLIEIDKNKKRIKEAMKEESISKGDITTGIAMTQSIGKITTTINKTPSEGKYIHAIIDDSIKNNNVVVYDAKLGNSLKEIIKRHTKDNNPYIEDTEIITIKKEFGLPITNKRNGYLSNDTIRNLFLIRIVNEQLDRHEEVNIKGVIDSIIAIFDLSLIEMNYNPIVLEQDYDKAFNAINYVRDRNYVEEYNKLYKKLKTQSSKFSKEEKDELINYMKSSEIMKDFSQLPTPEEFRKMINEESKKRIDWQTIVTRKESDIVYNVSRYTRYMTPEELAEYYHNLQFTLKEYKPETLQHLFIKLIEMRMSPMKKYMTRDKMLEEIKRRRKAVSREYLHEDLIGINTNGILVKDNYAKSSIELREASKRDETRKQYFRLNKTNNAIGLMSFKNLKQRLELKKFTEKGILTDTEIERVRSMF